MSELKLIVMDNFKEVGEKVLDRLGRENTEVKFKAVRFSNGEGKANISGTIRGQDVYILSDVGNYGITYKMLGKDQRMSPDDHFQDIKRVIAAMSGQAHDLTVVMPLLYEARQHRKKAKESLDCALALRELEYLGVKRIITMDCHDPNVCNAVPTMQFENFFPTNEILREIILNEKTDNLIVISPDQGAMERAKNFTDILEVDAGTFYKRRDHSKIVDGKNPIIDHIYMGPDVAGKDIIVVDDMLASGGSMLDVCKKLKGDGANEITLVSTFSLFTEGIEKFDKAKEQGVFDRLYTTNLTYIPEEYKKRDWFNVVDCSKKLADIIKVIHENKSIKPLKNGKAELVKLLEEKNNKPKIKEL